MNRTSLKTLMRQNDNNDKKSCYCFAHNGKYVFANNYTMYVCNDNFDYTQLHDKQINDTVEKFTNDIDDYSIFVLINMNKLTAFYKSIKPRSEEGFKNNPYIIDTDDIKIGFNAKYLLNMLKAFKTDYIYCKNSTSPCVTSKDLDDDYGLLMPILVG